MPWRHVAPACSALQFTLIYTFLEMYSVPLRCGFYEYPSWGKSLGICMGLLSCLQVPLWAVVSLCRESGTLSDVSVRGGTGQGDGDRVGAEQGQPLLTLAHPRSASRKLPSPCAPGGQPAPGKCPRMLSWCHSPSP